MKAKLFIDRPILAACISALILMLGIIGLVNLPMEQYPDIAPPTVQVSATYTGASAETVQKAVIVPLEEEINGVENMMYMTSTASNTGSATINVYFKQGTDPDMATVNVQNRVTKAQGTLPSEVTKIGVTAQKRQNSQLMLMSLYSTKGDYDEKFLANYLKINVVPRIQRISGVGEVMVMGNDYAMRIWLKPDVMAQYGLVPSDIITILGEQNIEASTGTLGEDSQNTFQYTLKYRGRYENSEELGDLVVRTADDGNTLRLKDVADIELGTTSYNFSGGVSGYPGATFMVMQTAGSNANEIIKEINKMADEIRADLPDGLKLDTMMSIKSFLDASVKNVIKTLIEAILLVIIVVYVFLQSVRSTFIPLVGIVVSLVGTFAFLYVAGFSINLLTLFALVLVIGTVVDDSIVVVEAVQAKFDEGYKSPYKATMDAMGGITSAIVTTSLVFMAVFIPVSFMGGTTGTFYTQFGLTMAVAVGISALNKRPEIQSAVTTFDTRFPQYLVEVDAARCKRADISPSDVLDVLSCYVGGNYASNINRFSKIYRVMVQAKPEYRLNKESLDNMYVRSSSRSMAPVGQFVTLSKTYGPEILSRFNLFSTISVNATPAQGYSSGDAIEAVREVAKKTLPAGYGYEFGGTSREEASSGTSIVVIFVICVLFIYIILCSLYESLFVPLAVMLSIPFGLMGSFLFAKMFGVENNVYMQTGLIMLIGLLAKTAILVTEYASERRRHGMTIVQAALSAAAVRLRPILMTALTMIIGLFPLVIATGAGANGNISLGVGTVGGMLIGTVALLFVVPVLFIVFQTIEERVMPKRRHREQEIRTEPLLEEKN